MKTALDPEAAALTIEFEDREAFAAFAAEMAERQAFLVRLDREVRLHSSWQVRLLAPGADFACAADAVQMLDAVGAAVGVCFELRSWTPERAEELARAARGEPAPSAEAEAPPDEGETLGTSPSHRIRELNPTQRAILAAKASRAERQILLRDTSPQVLQSLLVNPRLEAKEVLALVKSTRVTAAILQRVAGDGRWGKNTEIVTAVARNPKTPSPLAVRLMDQLRTQDLRRMAKMSGGLRENVRRAALREYLRRTQGR